MSKRFTIDDVRAFVVNNSRCELVSDTYESYIAKLSFKCQCGQVFQTSFSSFKNKSKRQCNDCTKASMRLSKAFTYDFVKEYIEKNSNCKLLSKEYINSNEKLKLQCECGNKFETDFGKFRHRNKRQCNGCSGVARYDVNIAKEEFIKNGLTPLFDKFVSVKSHLKGMTKEGYLVQITLEHLMNGKTPDTFSPLNPYTIRNISLWLEANAKGFKILSGEYKNNYTPLSFKCSDEHIFSMSWNDFKRRAFCTVCSSSIGEQRVAKWLNGNEINYMTELTFDNLRGKNNRPYRFDFAILNADNALQYIIEYDGEHHFEPARYSKDKQVNIRNFKQTVKRDNIKNQYCSDNNIPLLRIPYWEFDNIEEILDACHSVFFNANF